MKARKAAGARREGEGDWEDERPRWEVDIVGWGWRVGTRVGVVVGDNV